MTVSDRNYPDAGPVALSVVVPVYNEVGCVDKVVSDIYDNIINRHGRAELIVVDDGSSDGTGQVLDAISGRYPALKVIHQENKGHGPAVLTGYRHASGEWVFQTDSDDQFVVPEFWKLWEGKEGAELVLGVRAERKDAFVRLVVTRVLRAMVYLICGGDIPDVNIPFRLFRRDVFERCIVPHIPDDALIPNVMMSVLFRKGKFAVRSYPITHKERVTGEAKLSLMKLARFCVKSTFQLLSILGSGKKGENNGEKIHTEP
ncbi:MAG: glycosyltransferase family 2 protein [Candidatus Omnitrophica bacterium]|nr:glycosyltransferase family 2 protein [Candidatus Omnitrophota bacterium]MDD5488762.1 glycosyltransferase family 2 protein [Candidatus Omnitrophota bacterium]